jgi:hypothetical protein
MECDNCGGFFDQGILNDHSSLCYLVVKKVKSPPLRVDISNFKIEFARFVLRKK